MTRLWTLSIPAACIALAGCGTEKVAVPNVIGEQAGTAVQSIEDKNLVAALTPEPEDRSLCTVESQSETGEVDEGTEVRLRLTCQLDIPDVTGQTAADAKAAMRAAGVEMNFEGGSPRDESTCTVLSQSQVGEAPPDTHVTLPFTCPLTLKDVEEHANEFAAKPDPEGGPFDYELSGCEVLNHDEGQCEVIYNYSDGIVCQGTIEVTLNEDASIANVEHASDITCF